MINPRPLAQTFLALALIAGGASAQAAETVRSGVSTGMGRWIAAQGNVALQQMHRDLKRDLAERLQPMLPDAEMVVEADSTLVKVGNEAEAAPAATPINAQQSL